MGFRPDGLVKVMCCLFRFSEVESAPVVVDRDISATEEVVTSWR
jgi:hypothetical protein